MTEEELESKIICPKCKRNIFTVENFKMRKESYILIECYCGWFDVAKLERNFHLLRDIEESENE